MRPYTAGITAVLSLPVIFIVLFSLNPHFNSPFINLGLLILSIITGSTGLYLFILSNKKQKEINKESFDNKTKQSLGWKFIVIATIILIFLLLLVSFGI